MEERRWRRLSRPQAGILAVVFMVVAAVAVGIALQVTPPRPAPSAALTATSAPTTASPPTDNPDEWAPLELAPLQVAATLEPSATDPAGIPPTASFTLASLTGEPSATLAKRLEVTPATDFSVAAAADGQGSLIKPSAALTAGRTYRFVLHATDGSVAGSWAFRVRGPVSVTATIPGDATIEVPLRTGIEVTFDQEGVADMADHFSIEPAVLGTFERHGRTQVFVPNELAPRTTYTVTIRRGLTRPGTDLTLPSDVGFRFETTGKSNEVTRLVFARDVVDWAPGDPPLIAVLAEAPYMRDVVLPRTASVRVYRLPSLQAATNDLSAFLAAPRWTQFSDPLMPTDDLPVAVDFTAALESLRDNILLVRFPAALAAGWYIVQIEGPRPAQAFLQVTPVSAWVSVLTDRTVVWVNDVATHQAARGATVSVDGKPPFARSEKDGLALGPTPSELQPPVVAGDTPPPPYPILRVTSANGDVVLVPFNVQGDPAAYRGEWFETYGSADETYWAMLNTDRSVYRQTDRIQLWGYLRSRDDGQPPNLVQLRLVSNDAGDDAEAPAIAKYTLKPNQDGAFATSLPVDNLAIDQYQVQVVVAGRVVVSRWIDVSIIRKPAYQLALTPDHRAIVAGSNVSYTSRATFFDGTPVGSVSLVVSGDETGPDRVVTTNATGEATVTLTVPAPQSTQSLWEDPYESGVRVRPGGPESADIAAYSGLLVFPSAYALAAQGVVTGGELEISGSLHAVDLPKVERQLAAGTWNGDASGAAVAGKAIDVAVTELIPVRHQIRTEYNFIEKVSQPVYEYSTDRKSVPGSSISSGVDGTFALSVVVPDADHQYEVVLLTKDDAGHPQRRSIVAGKAVAVPWWIDAGVRFRDANGSPAGNDPYRIGSRISWQMVDGGRVLPSGGTDRYLYIVAQRGLRSAVVSDASTFGRRFAAADAPGIFVIGVRFTGATYAPKAAAWANFDQTEREIRVRITADRKRYRPGETATLSVRTTLPNGSPVSATVVIQAVDEKLYAIGGATAPRPLDDLYGRVDSGIIRLTATHQVPTMSGPEGEGGDTGGGGDGDRSDFRDNLLFREIRTDATGRASTPMTLSDDLTSWHVTASAVTGRLQAGVGELLVPVGLPFFVEVTVADTYLVSDRPSIEARAFGEALRIGDQVEFTLSSSLGLKESKRGRAFEPVSFTLPALSLGTSVNTISARATARTDTAGAALQDRLVRTFEVVSSRLTAIHTSYGLVTDGRPAIPDGALQSTWTFADAGRGRVLPILSRLADSAGPRIDRGIAYSMARQTLVEALGRDPSLLAPSTFDPSAYPSGTFDEGGTVRRGLALLPYSEVDPWLAARVAVEAPDVLQRGPLVDALAGIVDDPATRRDLRIAALAGLAALGEPVLDQLSDASRQPDLSPTEQIYLALGFEGAGADVGAQALERSLLAQFGERLGPWVRLRLDATPDGADPTALLAVVAAGLGDPLAPDLAEYAQANPASDTDNSLELAAYAARFVARTPSAPAAFAYTIDGVRAIGRLGLGEVITLTLTAKQAAGLAIENISGSVGVAVEARAPVAAGSLQPSSDLTLTRTLPAMPIASDRLIYVDIAASFGARAPDGCYEVVELVPSGLVPLTTGVGAHDQVDGVSWPSSVVGQEVRFCAFNSPTSRTAQLRYAARVVSAGSFTWELATMHLDAAPELLAITKPGTATINGR